jgi:SET domain-containing protein
MNHQQEKSTVRVKTPVGLAVKPVRNGRGIVALKSFRPGALICEIRGRIVAPATVWRYWDTEPRRGENCFRHSAERYLDPHGEIGQYANHSCAPNAGIVKDGRRLLLKAIVPIARGDEVTHDYATLLGADDVWTMRCNCGAPGCRRVVRNMRALPAAVMARYHRLGVIPRFIIATMNR